MKKCDYNILTININLLIFFIKLKIYKKIIYYNYNKIFYFVKN